MPTTTTIAATNDPRESPATSNGAVSLAIADVRLAAAHALSLTALLDALIAGLTPRT